MTSEYRFNKKRVRTLQVTVMPWCNLAPNGPAEPVGLRFKSVSTGEVLRVTMTHEELTVLYRSLGMWARVDERDLKG